jgi:hypothetical protein
MFGLPKLRDPRLAVVLLALGITSSAKTHGTHHALLTYFLVG